MKPLNELGAAEAAPASLPENTRFRVREIERNLDRGAKAELLGVIQGAIYATYYDKPLPNKLSKEKEQRTPKPLTMQAVEPAERALALAIRHVAQQPGLVTKEALTAKLRDAVMGHVLGLSDRHVELPATEQPAFVRLDLANPGGDTRGINGPNRYQRTAATPHRPN